MRRHNTLFVKSNKGNLYIFDLSKKEIFPCHRLVEHFYNLDTSNSESEEWGYNPSYIPCSNKSSKIKIVCGILVRNGSDPECMNSDC